MNLKPSKDNAVTRDERGGSKRQIASGGAILLTLSFRLEPEQQPATKDISDRMRKWNVYSKGTDKWAHIRHSWGFVWTVFFASDGEWSFLKQVSVRNGKSHAPPFYLLHLYINQPPTISSQLYIHICGEIEILSESRSMILFATEWFHLYTGFAGAT